MRLIQAFQIADDVLDALAVQALTCYRLEARRLGAVRAGPAGDNLRPAARCALPAQPVRQGLEGDLVADAFERRDVPWLHDPPPLAILALLENRPFHTRSSTAKL